MKCAAAAVFLLLITFSALASDGSLVPVFFNGPGAFGAQWHTEFNVFNNSDESVPGIQVIWACPVTGCEEPLPPHAAFTFPAVEGTKYNLGFLVFTRSSSVDVSYSARVFDVTRADANYGTDLPIVPLEEFTSRPLELMAIPKSSGYRVTLRLYAIPPAAPRVRVSVFEDKPIVFNPEPMAPRLAREQIYDLQAPPFPLPNVTFARPSGLVINDLFDGVFGGPFRIEIQSLSDTPVWGMATLTNNATQLVTVVVPRKAP